MASRDFCTTDELAAELGDPDLGVIDGSWHLPNTGRFGAGRIPARAYSRRGLFRHRHDRRSRHAPAAHAAETRRAGEGDDRAGARRRHALRHLRCPRPVRGGAGLVDAARLRRRGRPHPRGRPDEMDRRRQAARTSARRIRSPAPSRRGSTKAFVASLDEVRAALATGSAQVVDARPADRFRGEAPEPRPGLKSGHMPGSLNVPFAEVVEHGRLKPRRGAQGHFRRAQGRSREAGHHHLRLGRQRGDPGARRRGGGRQDRGALRRLVGRMGQPRRLPGGDRGGLAPRRGAGAKRMRRRPCIHANPLQQPPIAVLSVFNGLE